MQPLGVITREKSFSPHSSSLLLLSNIRKKNWRQITFVSSKILTNNLFLILFMTFINDNLLSITCANKLGDFGEEITFSNQTFKRSPNTNNNALLLKSQLQKQESILPLTTAVNSFSKEISSEMKNITTNQDDDGDDLDELLAKNNLLNSNNNYKEVNSNDFESSGRSADPVGKIVRKTKKKVKKKIRKMAHKAGKNFHHAVHSVHHIVHG